jgi:hypothetical protein
MTRFFVHVIYLISVVAAVSALLNPGAAAAADRVYLNRAEIESGLVGKPVLSKNLARPAVPGSGGHPVRGQSRTMGGCASPW